MPRLVSVPARLVRGTGGRPDALVVGRRRMAVAARLERWRESGEWWEGEAEREVVRLLLAGGAVVELSAEADVPAAGRTWRLDAWFD